MAKYFWGAFQATFFFLSPDLMWGNLNRFMSVSGIIKWFEVTIKGMLSYLLPKFEDIIPTSLGCGAIFNEIYSVMIQQYTALVDLDMYLTASLVRQLRVPNGNLNAR